MSWLIQSKYSFYAIIGGDVIVYMVYEKHHTTSQASALLFSQSVLDNVSVCARPHP